MGVFDGLKKYLATDQEKAKDPVCALPRPLRKAVFCSILIAGALASVRRKGL